MELHQIQAVSDLVEVEGGGMMSVRLRVWRL